MMVCYLTEQRFSRYSATDSLIGYLYQCRFSLLESIKRLRHEVEFTISIETLDDVVFEENGKPLELLQIKHKINRKADLSNSSSDLWKTIRIWSEGIFSGEIERDTLFFIYTTGIAQNQSAAYYLKCEKNCRNIIKALKILNEVTKISKNTEQKKYYDAFNSLEEPEKEELLKRIFIVDSSPRITDFNDVLREEMFYSVEKDHLNLFLDHLEGWWLRRIINFITKTNPNPILSQEIDAEIDKIRGEFKEDNLPIDEEIILATVNEEEYQHRTFVKQLNVIEINDTSIYHAIRNYFRAFEHRSKWSRNNLLLIGELDIYEDLLIEKWEIRFARMKEKLGKSVAHEEKTQAAKLLYEWIEDLSIPIRSSVTHPFMTSGSYQMLSDKKRIGWHPEFEKLIKKLEEE
jgi:hypothetical protein